MRLLSVTQAAQELGLHPATVREAIGRGTLKTAAKLGPNTAAWVIDYNDLMEWHNNKKNQPTLTGCQELESLNKQFSQVEIAKLLGVTKQAISAKLKRCKERKNA